MGVAAGRGSDDAGVRAASGGAHSVAAATCGAADRRMVPWAARGAGAVCLEALYEAHVERDAVRCGDGHLVCRCCLPRIVTASAARAPLNLSAEEQWSGRYLVRCPLHGHGGSAAA